MHDRGLLAAHPQFLPNPAIHPEYGAAAVAPVQKVRTDPLLPLRTGLPLTRDSRAVAGRNRIGTAAALSIATGSEEGPIWAPLGVGRWPSSRSDSVCLWADYRQGGFQTLPAYAALFAK